MHIRYTLVIIQRIQGKFSVNKLRRSGGCIRTQARLMCAKHCRSSRRYGRTSDLEGLNDK